MKVMMRFKQHQLWKSQANANQRQIKENWNDQLEFGKHLPDMEIMQHRFNYDLFKIYGKKRSKCSIGVAR